MNIFERKRLDAISNRLGNILQEYSSDIESVSSDDLSKALYEHIRTIKSTIDLMVTNSDKKDSNIAQYIRTDLEKIRANYGRIRELESKVRDLIDDIREKSTNTGSVNYTTVIRIKSAQNGVISDCSAYSLLSANLISSINSMLTLFAIEQSETTDDMFDYRVCEFSRLEYQLRRKIYEDVKSVCSAFSSIASGFDSHSADVLNAKFDAILEIVTSMNNDGPMFERFVDKQDNPA